MTGRFDRIPKWLNRVQVAYALGFVALALVALYGVFAQFLPAEAYEARALPWAAATWLIAAGMLGWIVQATARVLGRAGRPGHGGLLALLFAALILAFASHALWVVGIPAVAARVAGEPGERVETILREVHGGWRRFCDDGLQFERGAFLYDRACYVPERLLRAVGPGDNVVLEGLVTADGILWQTIRPAR